MSPRQPQTLPSDDLSSACNVDYTRLRNFLAAGDWRDADDETYLVMHKVLDHKGDFWSRNVKLLHFPCTDLRTIDSLWVKYSNGRFGFSVQKKIYLKIGGVLDGKYDYYAWEKFGTRVGWRKGWWMSKQWINYSEVTFDTSAPMGHLPITYIDGKDQYSYIIDTMRWSWSKEGEEKRFMFGLEFWWGWSFWHSLLSNCGL